MFSIITPSYNSIKWLPLCIASVKDQCGVDVEHIVQDGCSSDGTPDWATSISGINFASEEDEGMYDAINRGIQKASGEIVLHLNCDEQILPDALYSVSKVFSENRAVDIVIGDVIIVNKSGNPLCFRKAIKPAGWALKYTTLPTFTGATFIRKSFLDRTGIEFRKEMRSLGDRDWMIRSLAAGAAIKLLGEYTTTFTLTGANLMWASKSDKERDRFFSRRGKFRFFIEWVARLDRIIKKLVRGCYFEPSITYSIYCEEDIQCRREFVKILPSFRLHRDSKCDPGST